MARDQEGVGRDSGSAAGDRRSQSASGGLRCFYSVRFFDEEGDLCVKHAFLDDEEAEALMKKFVNAGVEVTMYQLSGPVRASSVLSMHAREGMEKKLLQGVG